MQPTLSPLRLRDIGETVRVFLEAFEVRDMSKASRVEDFWRLIYDSGMARFIVSRDDQSVIGCGALIHYPSHAWIAFMAVKPSLRGRGIGKTIMNRLMAEARDLGVRTVRLDATNWGKPLYLNCGFKDEYRVLWYEPLPTISADRATPVDVITQETLPPWCLEMDREAFGDDRSLLLRRVVASGAKVLIAGVDGFGILWNRKVGPVVAQSVEAATAIVREAQALGAERLYVPLHQGLPNQFLGGLREIKPATSIRCCDRMAFGDPLPEKANLLFASFTAATG